jgi:hypothetical protein
MQSSRSPSPISVTSTSSYHATHVLCDTNGTDLDLSDLYREQQQLTICSAPSCTQFHDPMSSATSFNASVELPQEEPLQLPPCRLSPSPILLSPCTIHTTLQSQPNIDNTLLQGIANGLLQTIADHETTTSIHTKCYKDRIHHLEQCVLHYKATFNEPPIGYELNNRKVSNFHIPVGDRLYQEVKWIKLNDDGMVSGYHSAQGPNKQPHIINLYAAPDHSVDSPLEALPAWFHHMLTGLGGDFQILQQAMADTDDWGLAHEIVQYRELNDKITVVAIKLEQYCRDLDAIRARLASCES